MSDTKIGYARTSTVEQEAGLEAQERELKAAGCKKVFREQVSSVGPRPKLEQALEYLREGDALVVTKLDRLARNVLHLGEILKRLDDAGASLNVLNLGADTGNATGELILNMLMAVAQFEREMMLERQREGIAKARAEGKYKGRKPTAKAKAKEVLALNKQGKGASKIAEELGIARSSVYRILDEHENN